MDGSCDFGNVNIEALGSIWTDGLMRLQNDDWVYGDSAIKYYIRISIRIV